MVDVILPSVNALQQSRPRQPQQALAEPQNRLPSCTVQCEPCYILEREGDRGEEDKWMDR